MLMCVSSRTRNSIHRTRACCSWRHPLVRPNRGRRLAMLFPRWRLHSTKIGLRQIAINVALSAWMMFVFSPVILPCSSLTCERFCSTRPLILCSNSLIVLIGFTGIVFRWVFCSRYLVKKHADGAYILQQWLGGASTCPVCRKPVHGPSSPRQSGLPPPPIQDIQNYLPFGTTWRRGPPPPGPGPGSNGHAGASGAWPRRRAALFCFTYIMA